VELTRIDQVRPAPTVPEARLDRSPRCEPWEDLPVYRLLRVAGVQVGFQRPADVLGDLVGLSNGLRGIVG